MKHYNESVTETKLLLNKIVEEKPLFSFSIFISKYIYVSTHRDNKNNNISIRKGLIQTETLESIRIGKRNNHKNKRITKHIKTITPRRIRVFEELASKRYQRA